MKKLFKKSSPIPTWFSVNVSMALQMAWSATQNPRNSIDPALLHLLTTTDKNTKFPLWFKAFVILDGIATVALVILMVWVFVNY